MDMTEYEHRQDGNKLKSRSRLDESVPPGAQPGLRIWWQLPGIKEMPSYSWVDGNWAEGTGREMLEGVSAWKNYICWASSQPAWSGAHNQRVGNGKGDRRVGFILGNIELEVSRGYIVWNVQWALGTEIGYKDLGFKTEARPRVQIWESANMAIRTIRMNKTVRECLNRENSWKWFPR